VHEILETQLAPRIAQKSANAVKTDRRDFYYFKRKSTGRRCSCFTEETSPENGCPICYGAGIVGGYDKFGTQTEVIDVTHPDLFLMNVEPTYQESPRPLYFKLINGYDVGYIEAKIRLHNNTGIIDTFYLGQPKFNKGTELFVITPDGNEHLIKEDRDFEQFLSYDEIKIRIVLRALNERPLVSHFLLRYKILSNQIIAGDLARAEENPSLSNLGIIDMYQEIPIFFAGDNIQMISPEDLLYRIQDGRRFKITAIKENKVAQTLTSVDATARYIIPSVDVGATNVLI
jgi:hypothetical protein